MKTITLKAILEFLIREFGYGEVNAEVQQIMLDIQRGKIL